jgi:alkylhydroperoxidase/carboxymuconolactone decarboxylase family protein YurZ
LLHELGSEAAPHQEEISEVLLQTAIDCGVAAAIDAFRAPREALKEMESE